MLPDQANSVPLAVAEPIGGAAVDQNISQAEGVRLPRIFAGLRVVAWATLLSRTLGMVRDIATAGLFGLGPIMDAFAFAFRIPNLSRRLFGEGALSAAFLPAFTRELQREDVRNRESAWQLASAVFTLLAVLLTGMTLIAELALWLAARFYATDPETDLLLGLTAVMLPYSVLICLAAQVTAVLHSLNHFAWPALVPVVLNVCWIASIWVVDPWFEPDREAQAYALAVCVVFAGALQLALQWPMLRRLGFRFNHNWRHASAGVWDVLRAMLPVTLGLAIVQINTLMDSLIAWTFSRPEGLQFMPLLGSPSYPLEPGAVSALYYGERLYQFPLGVFGVTLGTVLFPLFAQHAARGEINRLRDDFTFGLRLVIVIGVPASLGLMLLSEPLTRLMFQHGEFTAAATARTSGMIAAYGAGVWAYCGIPVLYRAFYALGDRTTPVRVGMRVVLFDQILNLTLIWPLAERGLACSTAISAALHVGILTFLIQQRVGRLDWSRLLQTSVRTILAGAVMTGACLASIVLCPTAATLHTHVPGLLVPVATIFHIDATFVSNLLRLLIPLVAGVATFFAGAYVFRLDEFWLLLKRERPA